MIVPTATLLLATAFIYLGEKVRQIVLVYNSDATLSLDSSNSNSSKIDLSPQSPYRIVIDGGSTGSRLHVFEFIQRTVIRNQLDSVEYSEEVECIRRGSWKAWPAMSSFARSTSEIEAGIMINASDVANHLVPLFDEASKVIPSKYHKTTPVKYQATAGMRLVELNEQDAVYDALYDGLVNSTLNSTGELFPFKHFQRGDIATLDGDLEGLYGAVAANYLHGSIDAELNVKSIKQLVNNTSEQDGGPIGALDMGGSSTQLVFLPHIVGPCLSERRHLQHDMHVDWDTCRNPTPERLEADEFYSYSYLSYGVDTFRERLWDVWIMDHQIASASDSDSCLPKVLWNPCSFKGYTLDWKGYTLYGTGNATECVRQVQRLLPALDEVHENQTCIDTRQNFTKDVREVGGVQIPPIRGKFFAFSLYYFTLDSLRALSTNDKNAHEMLNLSWPNPSIEELFNALHGLCSREWHDIKNERHEFTRKAVLPHRCIESVYIVTLLRDGYGFDLASRQITFTYLVNGSEVEWALGLALSSYSKEVGQSRNEAVNPVKFDDNRMMHEVMMDTI